MAHLLYKLVFGSVGIKIKIGICVTYAFWNLALGDTTIEGDNSGKVTEFREGEEWLQCGWEECCQKISNFVVVIIV